MTFEEILTEAIAMLQRQGRVAYRALTRQFDLDADYLEDLKEAILYAHPQVVDDGRGLVWSGAAATPPALGSPPATPAPLPALQEVPPPQSAALRSETHLLEAERRQLTVMFCDLVDSTPLSAQLDPEDLREVVRAYQQTCAEAIQRFDGHIAQLLGDGLLVYFGWPEAHEDDAQRAVRTGLGMLDAMDSFNTRLERAKNLRLAIRVGIHTGLVVVDEMGGGGHHEQLALGDTPNIASRIQAVAEPNTVALSAATYDLIQGYFICQDRGPQAFKGLASLQATGAGQMGPMAILAEAYGQGGHIAEGLTVLAEVLAGVAKTGERDGPFYRLRGELLLQQAVPDEAQAETCLQQALDIARRRQARSWELRAAVSLSRLWQRQGKRDAARALLAPIYGWFTEGFDTADLQEAMLLLEEL